jgi:hypothetical protein
MAKRRGLSMDLKGGRPLTGPAMLGVLGPGLMRAGLSLQASIQRATPVRTGTLRRSWATTQPQEAGARVIVYVGTSIVYARYQNTRTRNKGYIERGLKEGRDAAIKAFKSAINAGALWESGSK